MKRLTNEEVRVDESVDRYLGPLADLEGMKPKLLDLVLNGPVLNGYRRMYCGRSFGSYTARLPPMRTRA